MATNIYQFNGELLTVIADGTIDTTHSTLQMPGKGYQNYGEPVIQDILWAATNFAGPAQPNLPLAGQTWYNTNTNVLNVYTGTAWQAAGGVLVSPTEPAQGTNIGAFWYDSINLQLYIWDGIKWDLVGPLGSAINQDPISNTLIPSFSEVDAARISDGSNLHQVWRFTIGGTLFAIVSKDPTFVPNPTISGFPQLAPGINFNNNVPGVTITGDATLFKSTKNNLPIADNTYNMGSSSNRFASMFALNGTFSTGLAVGGATLGTYALNVNGTSNLNGEVTFAPGTTNNPPIQLQAGNLTVSPTLGALEFDGYNLWITMNQNNAVNRFAILAGQVGNVAAVPNTLVLRDASANIYANTMYGVATSALYADLAERYETDVLVMPGDVVIIGGAKEITTTTLSYDPNVFGVISTNPAIRMNEGAGNDETHPFVAMAGRVPCKVVGPVNKGQRLVTSHIAGIAMAEQYSGRPNAAFARSLVNKKTEGIEAIEVVLLGRA